MKKLAPNLLSVIDAVELKRETIASTWIDISTVKPIFKLYKISPPDLGHQHYIQYSNIP